MSNKPEEISKICDCGSLLGSRPTNCINCARAVNENLTETLANAKEEIARLEQRSGCEHCSDRRRKAEEKYIAERSAREKAEGLLPHLLAIIKQPSRHGLNWAAVNKAESILAARKEGEK